jgi:predicted TIM-barrel fold metal-dependent hydrolase
LIGNIFVFDQVIHSYDLSQANLRPDVPTSEHARHLLLKSRFTRLPHNLATDFGKRWTPDELYDLVFVQAPTDMAMAQVVPIFDWYKDWYAPVQTQYALAAKYPDRILFCGGVDPLYRGLQDALDQIEYQVKELGACSLKFYNAHLGRSWRCDDEAIAYPMYEKCRGLGIKVIQFHKGIPLGLQNVEDLRPVDLQAPARDFPDLAFVVHHLAVPYFDEMVYIAGRFPNVYLSLSGGTGGLLLWPRLVQERMGKLLQQVGVEKLLYGSEAALLGTPAPYLRAFMEMEIPEDLRSGYGYPQITLEDKEKILGLNFARLMNIDIEAKKRQFASNPLQPVV